MSRALLASPSVFSPTEVKGLAQLSGNLWEYNLVKVIVVDVSDDYRLMQPPMPSDFYPVIEERWLPRHNLSSALPRDPIVNGYLYDWHQTPEREGGDWYVGVVSEALTNELLA